MYGYNHQNSTCLTCYYIFSFGLHSFSSGVGAFVKRRRKKIQTTAKDRINYKKYHNDRSQFMMMMPFYDWNVILTLSFMSIHFKFNELYGVLFCWVQVFHGWNLDVIDLIEKKSTKNWREDILDFPIICVLVYSLVSKNMKIVNQYFTSHFKV